MTILQPKHILELSAHKGGVTSVSFSPDGQYLASSGYDSRICLWGTSNWQEAQFIKGHYRGHVAYSPNGSLLASGGMGAGVTIYNAHSLKQLHILKENDNVWALAFHTSEPILALAEPTESNDNPKVPILLIDCNSWQVRDRINIDAEYVYSVTYSPNGKYVAIATDQSTDVSVWTADYKHLLKEFSAHDRTTWSISWSSDSRYLLTTGSDGFARIWDFSSLDLAAEFSSAGASYGDSSNDRVLCAAFSPDGMTIASGNLDGQMNIWKLH